MILLPLCLLSLIASTFAVIGRDGCEDVEDGCLTCAKTYTIDTSHLSKPYGCFNSRGNANGNVLPYSSLQDHNKMKPIIKKEMWEQTGDADQVVAEICGAYAVLKGYKFYGVEYYGECYFGNEADLDMSQGKVKANECATRCKWDVGKGHTMMVFEVVNA